MSRYYGKYFPAAVLRERFLAVTSCRYVDKVILEAPYILTAKMLDEYKVIESASNDFNNYFNKWTIPLWKEHHKLVN